MSYKTKLAIASVFATGIPFLAFAATNKTLKDLIVGIIGYLNDILFLLMGLAVVMFVWYIIQYFIRPNDSAEGRKQAGLYVMYSLIGFFVILSFWGIVNILRGTFGGLGNSDNAPSSWTDFSGLFPPSSGSSQTSGNPPK